MFEPVHEHLSRELGEAQQWPQATKRRSPGEGGC